MDVLANDLVEHVLHNLSVLLRRLPGLDAFTKQINALLRREAIPDAVASNHQEFVITGQFDFLYFWHTGNHLCFNSDLLIQFILKISQSS